MPAKMNHHFGLVLTQNDKKRATEVSSAHLHQSIIGKREFKTDSSFTIFSLHLPLC